MAFNQTAAAPSHKMRRCLLMAFALIALAITALPTASFAGTDTAGNVLATDNDANPSGVQRAGALKEPLGCISKGRAAPPTFCGAKSVRCRPRWGF